MFLLYFLAFEFTFSLICLVAIIVHLVLHDSYLQRIRDKLEPNAFHKYEVFFDDKKLALHTRRKCFHNSADLLCAWRYFVCITANDVCLHYVIGRQEKTFKLSPKEIFLLLENASINPPYEDNIVQFSNVKRGAK